MDKEELKKNMRKIRKNKRIITELHQFKANLKTLKQKQNINMAVEIIETHIKTQQKNTEFLCGECGSVVESGKCSGCKKNYLK